MNYDVPVVCAVCVLKTERRGGERRACKEKTQCFKGNFKKPW